MTNALDDLIKDDDAAWIEIGFENGLVVAVVTVDEGGDEIAVYEDDDITDAVRAAAQLISPPSDEREAVSYPKEEA